MEKPLKYSDYKIQQGLYLQIEHRKYYEIEKNEEIFCMRMYAQYLSIIGFDNSKIFEYIPMIKKPNVYSDGSPDDPFNKEVENNIVELMDNIF